MSDQSHQNPFFGQTNNPATPRPAMANEPGDILDTSLRPVATKHDNDMRHAASERDKVETSIELEPFVEPNDQPRPVATEHGERLRSVALEHDEGGNFDSFIESTPAGDTSRPVMPEAEEQEVVEVEPEVIEPEVPPEHTDLVTVEEAVEIFQQRGLPRHMRTIQRYCSGQKGKALVSYQVPTENGIRYMIERSSIDRFIDDAAHQAPTGKLEDEPVVDHVDREPAKPTIDQGEIFDHPVVQRLEARIEKLESRNEEMQGRIETVLINANNSLVELQKANAVAQSKSLGAYLLESARIRQQDGDPAPVNREGVSS